MGANFSQKDSESELFDKDFQFGQLDRLDEEKITTFLNKFDNHENFLGDLLKYELRNMVKNDETHSEQQ